MSNRLSLIKAGFITLFLMSTVAGWHWVNDRPSSMDETKHMQLAMDYRDWLTQDVPLQNPWSSVYPPFYHVSTIPFMSIGTPTEAKAVIAHTFYAFLFLAGCLFLGRAHGRSDEESLAVSVLTLSFAYVLWASRRALTDFPMMAAVTLAMGLLARTQRFSLRRQSLQWGLFLGVAALIKFTFAIYFVFPVAWILLRGREPWRFKNAGLGLLAAALVAGGWYAWNSFAFLEKASGLLNESTTTDGDPRTFMGWFFYVKSWPETLGIPQTLFILSGLVLAVRTSSKIPRRNGDGFLWMWVLPSYVILSAMTNKDPRHTLPFLPALAFLAARGWNDALPKNWRPQFLWCTSGLLFICTLITTDAPAKEDWKIREIGQFMQARRDPSQPQLIASVISHHPRFFSRTLRWTLRGDNIALKNTKTGSPDASFVEFIIRREGNQGSEELMLDKEWRKIGPESRAFQEIFPQRSQYQLLDRSTVFIYQRDASPQFQVSPLSSQAVATRFAHSLGRWVSGPLRVSVQATPEGLRQGHLDSLTASCSSCSVHGATIPSLQVTLRRPRLNLYRLYDEDRLGLLAFESINAKLDLPAEALSEPLTRVKGLRDARVNFQNGKVILSGQLHNIPLRVTARPELAKKGEHAYLRLKVAMVRIAGLPIPGFLLGKASRQTLWLEPQPSFPGRIDITRLTLDHDRITLE